MADLEARVRRLEQRVTGLGEIVIDQGREIERLRVELDSEMSQTALEGIQL